MAILIYGVSGYVGALVSRTAAAYRMPHIVAARSPQEVQKTAQWTGLEGRAFELHDPNEIARWLGGVRVVVNCASPYKETAIPLAKACMMVGAHYLDLSGQASEHLAVKALNTDAINAGIMLMPGIGFSLMPGDCLASLVAAQVTKATHLTMGFHSVGPLSRGTMSALLGSIDQPGMVRRNGELEPCYPGASERVFSFGGKETKLVTNPWRSEVVGCYKTTGIREIQTFSDFPRPARYVMKFPEHMEKGAMQWYIERTIRKTTKGPTDKQLYKGSSHIYAHVQNRMGDEAALTLLGPELYRFTALTAIACAHASLIGTQHSGYQTPARAFGADLIGKIEGVSITA